MLLARTYLARLLSLCLALQLGLGPVVPCPLAGPHPSTLPLPPSAALRPENAERAGLEEELRVGLAGGHPDVTKAVPEPPLGRIVYPNRKALVNMLVRRIQRERMARPGEPLWVAVGGYRAAGKSLLTEEIREALEADGVPAVVFKEDWFYIEWATRARWRSEDGALWKNHRAGIDSESLHRAIESVARGLGLVSLSHLYNSRTGERTDSAQLNVLPGTVVLYDGLYATDPERHQDGVALWLHLSVDFQTSLRRSEQRDPDERGRGLEVIRARQREVHGPSYAAYLQRVRPWQWADVVVDTTDLDRPVGLLYEKGLDQRLARQALVGLRKIVANVQESGAIAAASSRAHPSYGYDWLRDSWNVVWALLRLQRVLDRGHPETAAALGIPRDAIEEWRATIDRMIQRHLAFVRDAKAKHGIDPYVQRLDLRDGAPRDNWSFQPDGAGLGVLALAAYAQTLSDDEVRAQVLPLLEWYLDAIMRRGQATTEVVEGRPMEDLWEQVRAKPSLFAALVHAAALDAGAQVAERLGLSEAAAGWRLQAEVLRDQLEGRRDGDGEPWYDPARGHFKAHLELEAGHWKSSNLDAAIIGGWLYAQGPWGPRDPRLLETVQRLDETFRGQYPINRDRPAGVVLWGRFAEDPYDGVALSGHNNPWTLTTLWRIRWLERYADALRSASQAPGGLVLSEHDRDILRSLGIETPATTPETLINEVRLAADRTLATMLSLLPEDQSLPEQLLREERDGRPAGAPQGARDLTWANAELLLTLLDRLTLRAPTEDAAAAAAAERQALGIGT